MSLHGFGDLGIELLDRLAGLLNLIGQELDSHRRRCDQRVITRQQLGGTNALDDLILLFFASGGVVTEDAT